MFHINKYIWIVMSVENKIITWRIALKERILTFILMIAMFFNPIGFDALFACVMKLTGSYWITDLIFYLTSALFFGLYFLLRKLWKKQ